MNIKYFIRSVRKASSKWISDVHETLIGLGVLCGLFGTSYFVGHIFNPSKPFGIKLAGGLLLIVLFVATSYALFLISHALGVLTKRLWERI